MSYSSDIPSLQNQLPLSIETSEDPKEFRYEFNDTYQTIASAVNNKVGGLYVPQEKINSEQYFDPVRPQRLKNVYRMTVDFGALPNSTIKSVPHNIIGFSPSWRITASWGGATNPNTLSYIPFPNQGIFIEINSTDVNMTTSSDFSSYTESNVVFEYTKG